MGLGPVGALYHADSCQPDKGWGVLCVVCGHVIHTFITNAR